MPDLDPIAEILSIHTPGEKSTESENITDNNEEINKPASIEEAFNSFF